MVGRIFAVPPGAAADDEREFMLVSRAGREKRLVGLFLRRIIGKTGDVEPFRAREVVQGSGGRRRFGVAAR